MVSTPAQFHICQYHRREICVLGKVVEIISKHDYLNPLASHFADPAAHNAEGRGSLIDKHTVEVQLSAGGTKKITGKTILLANGWQTLQN